MKLWKHISPGVGYYSPSEMRYYRPPSETVPQWRGGPAAELSLNDVFTVLADKRRRLVLYALRDQSGEVPVDRLLDQVVEWEEHLGEQAGERTRNHLTVALYHRHLPRLDTLDIVDFDDTGDTVRYHGHPLLNQWLHQTRELDEV